MALFNVRNYGTTNAGNAKLLRDGAMANGSDHLTSASNPFVVGDVGKSIWIGGSANPNAPKFPIAGGTITAYNSAGDVTLSATAAAAITGAYAAWGQDDTGDFVLAQAAALADTEQHGTVYAPTGIYICAGQIFNATGQVCFVGDGPNSTVLIPTTDLPAGASLSGSLIDSYVNFNEVGNFSVLGLNQVDKFMAQQQAYVRLGGAGGWFHDILMQNLGSLTADTMNLVFYFGHNICVERVLTQVNTGIATGGDMGGVRFLGCYGQVNSLTASNHSRRNLWIDVNAPGGGGYSGIAGLLNFNGGLIDELGGGSLTPSASVHITSGGEATFNGVNFWGPGASGYAVYVDGTSKARLHACEAGPFGVQSKNALLIDAGGVVYASQSIFRGAGADPVCIINNGNLVDCGGNVYRNGDTGTEVYTDISFRRAISVLTRPNYTPQGDLVTLPR